MQEAQLVCTRYAFALKPTLTLIYHPKLWLIKGGIMCILRISTFLAHPHLMFLLIAGNLIGHLVGQIIEVTINFFSNSTIIFNRLSDTNRKIQKKKIQKRA